MSKLIAFFIIVFIIGCSSDSQHLDLNSEQNKAPISIELNLEEGYTFNVITGKEIEPLTNSKNEIIITGIEKEFIGNDNFKDSILDSSVTNLKLSFKKNVNEVYILDSNFVTTGKIDPTKLTVSKNNTKTYKTNLKGDTIITGIPVLAKGKILKYKPLPSSPVLPARMKDPAKYNIQYLGSDEGLPSTKTVDILHDKTGNLWLTTEDIGVLKYDGTSFTNHSTESGLPGNSVNAVVEDTQGSLWFSIHGKGLVKFDGDKYVYYTDENGLLSNIISSMIIDKQGNLWIASAKGGLTKFDGKHFTHYTANEGLNFVSIWTLAEGINGNIWLSTFGTGLTKFDGKTFTNYDAASLGLDYLFPLTIKTDKNGDLWIGRDGGGLSKIFNTLVGESFTHYDLESGVPISLILDIVINDDGSLWLSTNDKGLSYFDGSKFRIINDTDGLTSNYIGKIEMDATGYLWVSSRDEIFKFKPNNFKHYTNDYSEGNQVIQDLLEDKNKNIWIAKDGNGVQILYEGQNAIINEENGLQNNFALSLFEDHIGNVWIGSYGGGLHKYDGVNITNYSISKDYSSNSSYDITEDKDGNIWTANQKHGLSKFNHKYFTFYNEESGIPSQYINVLYRDSNDILWVGTKKGLLKIKDNKITIYSEAEGLSSNDVNTITEDKNGNLWVGTYNGGISIFKEDKFIVFTTKQGLISNNINSIQLVAESDNSTSAWIGTEKGLCSINIKSLDDFTNYTIHKYTKKDGLKSDEFRKNSVLLTSDKKLYWGGSKSLTSIDLDKFSNSNNNPTPILHTIEINEKWLDYRNLSDSLRKFVRFKTVKLFENYPTSLDLDHNYNHLTFYFSLTSLHNSHRIKYQYKLNGLDEDWSAATIKSFADYRNLPYGNYTFLIRSKIGYSDNWSDTFTYPFSIQPPWWHTWWARLIYSGLGLLTVILIVKWRTNKLIKNQIILEEKITVATKQIRLQKDVVEKQRDEVEEAHKEIRDSINYAERIQRSFLATKEVLDRNLSDYFVFFQPKDVVSGDFYWADQLSDGNFAILNADSTGHGVPGAIMSILNISSIEKAIEKGLSEPSDIFNDTRSTIIERLSKDGSKDGGKDGMDASLISFNKGKTELKFVAANNPIWIIRNKEIIEIKGEKMPVGKHEFDQVHFKGGSTKLIKNDVIYTLTDGFQDQFGGDKGKKFMVKSLKKLMIEIAELPMKEQKTILKNTFEEWRTNVEQVDDVCIIGVRV